MLFLLHHGHHWIWQLSEKRSFKETERNIEEWKNSKWAANKIGESGARMISESLKTNTTLTTLYLYGDEKWSIMKWIIIIIKKTKGWKNEMNNINDNENTEEREI